MIEITISFGNENGDGLSRVLVDVEPLNHGFDTSAYQRSICAALEKFEKQQRFAAINSVHVRIVPNEVIRLQA